MKLPRNYDLIIAGAILALSTSLVTYAYASFLKLERPPQVLIKTILPGIKKYFILSEDKCIGEYFTNLEVDKNYFLHSKAEAAGAYGAIKGNANLQFSGQFNPLGQFFEGHFEISAGGFSLKASAKETNPIKIHVTAQSGSRSIDQTFSIPGPLEIKHSISGQYRVEYAEIQQGASDYLQLMAKSLLKDISISFIEAKSSGLACKGDDRHYFDVASLILQFQQQGSALSAFMPPVEEQQ
jgi:hypothetical protein